MSFDVAEKEIFPKDVRFVNSPLDRGTRKALFERHIDEIFFEKKKLLGDEVSKLCPQFCQPFAEISHLLVENERILDFESDPLRIKRIYEDFQMQRQKNARAELKKLLTDAKILSKEHITEEIKSANCYSGWSEQAREEILSNYFENQRTTKENES